MLGENAGFLLFHSLCTGFSFSMMMAPLLSFLDRHHICHGRMLVGVSGGADSVALLCALQELSGTRQLQLCVAHFDHALRKDSCEDAHWVQSLCEKLKVPCILEQRIGKLPGEAASESMAAEETARKWRYDFFQRLTRQEDCRWLALAHTADDQVETILHHIVRGSGLKGLSGIPAVRLLSPIHRSHLDLRVEKCEASDDGAESRETDPNPRLRGSTGQEATSSPIEIPQNEVLLIRPLLEVRRCEIEAYLAAHQQLYRTDSTNASPRYTRNRIRNEILPVLRTELNPRVDQALLQLSQQARDAQEVINTVVRDLLTAAVLDQQTEIVRLQRDVLLNRPMGLLREFFSQLWEVQGWPRQGQNFAHLDQLARMVLTQSPRRLSLPGKVEACCREKIFELRRTH